jgi:sugar-specific transcriptional regulator TrmB
MEELLRSLGLTKYEIDAYLTLLKFKNITAYSLGQLSGVPQGRIYDVVEKLMSKGLVELHPGKPKKFSPIDPKIAIANLLAKKEKEVENLKGKFKEFIKSYEKESIATEPISIVRGREIFYWKLVQLISTAKKEVLSIAGGLSGEERGVPFTKVQRNALKRGVKIKVIIPLSEKNKEVARKMLKMGTEVRDYPISGLRLNIVDENTALIAVVDEKLPFNREAILIQNKNFCKGMKKVFNELWKEAKPLS